MDRLEKIVNKFEIDPTQKGIIKLPISRWKEWPQLLNDLDIQKMVEIGTYKGQFAECLMKNIVGLDLTVVDAWKVYRDYKDYGVNDLETAAYDEAINRSKKYGFKIIKAWSLDAVKEFEDGSLDMVFIDANHDFRHVVEDVDEWSRKVKSGGIVAGHDFFRNHHKRFGVREALPAWCEANEIPQLFVVSKDSCPSWFYIKP